MYLERKGLVLTVFRQNHLFRSDRERLSDFFYGASALSAKNEILSDHSDNSCHVQ